MERAISYITVFPDSQSGIKLFVDQVLDQIEARKSLELLAKLTAMEKIIEGIKEGIKSQILDEADLSGEKIFEINGIKYEKRNRTTYYYHNCAMHEELKTKLKKMEDIMKVINEPIADVETGEIIPPALKSYTEYISVTLKK